MTRGDVGGRPDSISHPVRIAGFHPLWSVGAAAIAALALLLIAPADRALAACTPPTPIAGAEVTCTGATVNQNFVNGYGNLTSSGTVTVVPGASVTGPNFGILLDTGTVKNFGTILGDWGVSLDTGGTVINSGTIVGRSDAGLHTNGPLFVVNTGFIAGATHGIISGGGATYTVVNSGTITGGTFGIANFGGAYTIINSGIISAPTAISLTGDADTLTLLRGSTIIGRINLGGGADTVNVRTGNQNLTFTSLAGVTVTGTVPFAVSGNRIASIDPTVFAVASTMLGDFTRSVSTVVPVFDNPSAVGAMPSAFAAPASPSSIVSDAFDSIPGLSAYAADHVAFKAPTVTHADGISLWARGFAGQRVQQADGMIPRYATDFFGGAMGADKLVSPNLRIGAFVGAGSTRANIDGNIGDTDSNLGFGGLYARYASGAWFLHAGVQGGGSRSESTRNNINNNLVATGIETAKASYDGWYVSPDLTLGHRIALGEAFGAQYALTPSVQVRYLYGSFGSYTETGSTANLTVNSQTVQTLEERAELKFTIATMLGSAAANVHLTGGALGIQRVGGNSVDAVLLGQAIPFATPGKDDVWGGFGGLGIEARRANIAVFASGEYLALNDDSSVLSGKAGMRVAF